VQIALTLRAVAADVVQPKSGLPKSQVRCSSTLMKSACQGVGTSRSGVVHAITSISVIRTECDGTCREFRGNWAANKKNRSDF